MHNHSDFGGDSIGKNAPNIASSPPLSFDPQYQLNQQHNTPFFFPAYRIATVVRMKNEKAFLFTVKCPPHLRAAQCHITDWGGSSPQTLLNSKFHTWAWSPSRQALSTSSLPARPSGASTHLPLPTWMMWPAESTFHFLLLP